MNEIREEEEEIGWKRRIEQKRKKRIGRKDRKGRGREDRNGRR